MRTQIKKMRRQVIAIEQWTHTRNNKGDENNGQRDENADGRDENTRYGD